MKNIQKFEFNFIIIIALIMNVINSPRSKNRAGRGVSTGNMQINKSMTKKTFNYIYKKANQEHEWKTHGAKMQKWADYQQIEKLTNPQWYDHDYANDHLNSFLLFLIFLKAELLKRESPIEL